ncbi:MAG: hypothetical protein ACRCUM_02575 [Mycoplasmoidaceae bacterium]
MSKTILKWNDSDFWDSSPRFLFKQFDLFVEHNKKYIKNNKVNNNSEEVERKKFKVLDFEGGD